MFLSHVTCNTSPPNYSRSFTLSVISGSPMYHSSKSSNSISIIPLPTGSKPPFNYSFHLQTSETFFQFIFNCIYRHENAPTSPSLWHSLNFSPDLSLSLKTYLLLLSPFLPSQLLILYINFNSLDFISPFFRTLILCKLEDIQNAIQLTRTSVQEGAQ